MSKFYDIRQQLKQLIIAAGIGWSESNVLIESVGDLWNDAAAAIAAAGGNGCVLVLNVADGAPLEKGGLNIETTFPMTILADPSFEGGEHPLEALWDDLLTFVHNLKLNDADHDLTRFMFAGFQPVAAERNGNYLAGRATNFTRRTIFKSKHL